MPIIIWVLLLFSVCLSIPAGMAQQPKGFDDAAVSRSSLSLITTAAADTNSIFLEGFDDDQLLKRGWYDGERFEIETVDPKSGTGSVRYHWKAGASTPHSSSGVRRLFEPSESVCLSCYIRLSKNWKWTNRPYHPHLMHFMTTENSKWHGPAASHLTVYVEPWNGRLRLAATDIQNQDSPHGLTQGPLRGGYNGTTFDSRETLFTDDQWHFIEAYFQLNTLDVEKDKPNADGIVRGWFDGKLVIERNDVVLRSTDFPRMKFNQFLLTPYFGPGLLPQSQTLWIDELSVSARRDDASSASGTELPKQRHE